MLLTDGFIANGSEPWRIPSMKDYPKICPPIVDEAPEGGFMPYVRNERLARGWAFPGKAGLEHRVGGLEKDSVKGSISTDPANHQKMVDTRAAKVALVADDIPVQKVWGDEEGDLLVVGWGGTRGHLQNAVDDLRREGHRVSLCHFNYIHPLPHGVREIFSRFRKIVVCELNEGQFANYLRHELQEFSYEQYNKCEGQPFTIVELREKIRILTEITPWQTTNTPPADFKSDQEVRWCPGCGDHAILNAVQRALPEIADATDTPHNLFTFVSGIGCSSRFIYYMKTFGFHSIHGRANAVATGVKVANPRLNVWVTTGDGDSLAIGGNHFIHAIRRNVDLNVILFNNEIYGLTKGQYSPTSKLGKITKTSPYGTVEKPFNPGELVIGAKGTFFARSIDMEVQLSKECMVAAAMHRGMSVVEVMQNCVIFNDKTHAAFAADKATRAERTITLRHGEKMLFGANREKGLVFENMRLKVVTVGQDGYTLDDILTHDAHERDTTLHVMLAAMKYPDYPVALGVIRAVEDDAVYDRAVERQVEEVKAASKIHSVDDLLRSGATWEVE